MFASRLFGILLASAFLLASSLTRAAELEVDMVVRDAAGNPVAGADVALFGMVDTKNSPDLRYYRAADPTDQDGRTHLSADEFRETSLVYIWQKEKNLVALVEVEKKQHAEPVEVTLGPACRVFGKLTSTELEQLGHSVKWANVYVMASGGKHRPLSYMGDSQAFEFFLPPGKYQLYAYGEELNGLKPEIEVVEGQSTLDVGAIDLPASTLAKLMGKTAPELKDIVGWASGEPATLGDLRGKVVILDFWGYWCGPCIQGMPDLMALHDDYADRDLAIIAVHDASVANLDELRAKLAPIVSSRWSGREIPFRLALDGGAEKQGSGQGATTRLYGISSFPTSILIDREGKVVGQFHAGSEQSIAQMRELLSLPAAEGASETPAWRREFEAAYRLADGEALKRVSFPFTYARAAFITHQQTVGSGSQRRIERLTVFENTNADSLGMNAGNANLGSLLNSLIPRHLPRQSVEIAEKLRALPVQGDWTVRSEAPLADRMRALEKILNDDLQLKIKIEPREVEREVIVINGDYKFQPLPGAGDNPLLSLTTTGDDLQTEAGGGAGNVDALAGFLARLIDRPVIDESTSPQELSIEWRQRDSSIKGLSTDAANVTNLLAMLQSQTGLKFEQTKRNVEVWFVDQRE